MSDFQSRFLPEKANPALRELIARACRWREEPEAFLELVHEDARLRVMGDRRSNPIYGLHEGRERIRALLALIGGELGASEVKILNVLVAGENFAIRRVTEARHHGSGASASLFAGFFVRTREAKVQEIDVYVDTALLDRLISG